MSTKASIALLLIIGVVLPACRKDHPILIEGLPTDCVPTPPTPMLGWTFQVPEHTVNGPRFNPSSGGEVMFVERPFGSQTDFILWRYDINAGTMVEVLSGSNLVNMSFPADWGSNGWVLLNLLSAEGQNIFKLRDIGDSLQQVTFTNGNLSPVWSPSSFAFGYSVIDGSGRSVKVVTSTGLSDTLVEVPLNGSSCWFEEGRVASVGMSGVFVGGVETDEMMWICDMPQDLYDFASPAGIAVLPDHETILWMHTGGLYRTNSASGVTQQLSRTCNSQYFVGLDYSPQTNKLVTTRITRTPVSAQELRIETDIVLMNPDGTGQEVLVFPFPE